MPRDRESGGEQESLFEKGRPVLSAVTRLREGSRALAGTRGLTGTFCSVVVVVVRTTPRIRIG